MHARVLALTSLVVLAGAACSADEVAVPNADAETGTGDDVPEDTEPLDCDTLPDSLDEPVSSWVESEDTDILLRNTAILPDGDFVVVMSDLVFRGAADGTLRWSVEAGSADSYRHVSTNDAGDIAVFGWALGHPLVLRYLDDGELERRVTLDDPNDEILSTGVLAPGGEVFVGNLIPDLGGSQVRKLDAELEEVWSVNNDDQAAVLALAADADANVYLATHRFGSVLEDYPASPSLIAWHVELSARDAAGELLWTTSELEFPSINVPRMQLELGDRLYLAVVGEPGEDATLWAFDSDGQQLWELRDSELEAVGASPCGGLYAAGGSSWSAASGWRVDAEGVETTRVDLGAPTLEGIGLYRAHDVMVSSLGEVVVIGSVGDGSISEWRWWTQRY